LYFGSLDISCADFFKALFSNNTHSHHSVIIYEYRLPKAATAIFCGMGLSLAGLLLQTLFQNPLAGPYVLGINSGASLGVAVWVMTPAWMHSKGNWLTQSGPWACAWLGASLVLLLVLSISKWIRQSNGLLIFGLMVGYTVSACVSLLSHFSSAQALQAYARWNEGSFALVSSQQWFWFALPIAVILVGCLFFASSFDVLLLGEVQAKSLGLSVATMRRAVVLVTGFLAGSCTAYCGPIAFLGLAVPLAVKMSFQEALHRRLIPLCAIWGGCAALLADLLAAWPGKAQSLPLNAILALMGAPLVILVILSQMRSRT